MCARRVSVAGVLGAIGTNADGPSQGKVPQVGRSRSPSALRIIGRAVGGYANAMRTPRGPSTPWRRFGSSSSGSWPSDCWVWRSSSRSRSASASWSPGRSTPTPRVRRSCPPPSRARRSRWRTSGSRRTATASSRGTRPTRRSRRPRRRFPWGPSCRRALTTVRLNGEDGPSVPLLFRDGADAHLEFKGEPPGPGEIALAGNAPQTQGLRIGDRVTLVGPSGKETELTVSGTFLPPDPSDPFWFGSRSPFPPPDSTQVQPQLVSRDTALQLADTLGPDHGVRMGRLPGPRGGAVRGGAGDPRAAQPDRGPAARRARAGGRPGPHRTRHAPADRGSAGGEPARADPARRVPDRRRDARRARGRRRPHAHTTGVRAVGAAQPRLLPPDAAARAGRASRARGAGRVPARSLDRPGPGEPRRPHERSVAPRRAVPRAAEPVRRWRWAP